MATSPREEKSNIKAGLRLSINAQLKSPFTKSFPDGILTPVGNGPKTPAIQSRPRLVASRWRAVAAIGLGLGVIAFLSVVAAVPIYVGPKHAGEPTSRERTGYTLGTNVINVIVSVLIASRLKSIWLDSTESKLGRLEPEQRDNDAVSLTSATSAVSRMKKTLVRDTLLGLSSTWERLYCWNVIVCLAMVGLVATSINSAITLTSIYDYREFVNMTIVAPQLDGICTYLAEGPEAAIANPAKVTWPLPNGSYLGVYTNDRQGVRFDKAAADEESPYSVFSICPVMNAITMLGSGIYPNTSNIWPYMVLSAGVYNDSLGFPMDVYDGVDPVFWSRAVEGLQKVNFQSALQCVPVMTKNPVQCKRGGALDINVENKTMTIFDGEGNCNITSQFYGVNLANPENGTTGGATVSGMCSGANVGEATIVMGSIGKHAENLAGMMDGDTPTNQTYTITCTISIADTLDFRRVNYSRTEKPDETDVNVQYAVRAVSLDSCTPPGGLSRDAILTPSLIATAALGPLQLLSENYLNDGWYSALSKGYYHSYHNISGHVHMSFSNSANNLEDIFGVTASMMMGSYMGTDDLAREWNQITLPGTAVYMKATRIGSGMWYAWLFLIPTVFTIGLLVWFLVKEHRNGGLYA